MRSRTPLLLVVAGLSAALLASACSSTDGAVTTVTSATTVAPSSSSAVAAPGSSDAGSSSSSGSSQPGSSSSSSSSGGSSTNSSSSSKSSSSSATTSKPATGTGSFDHPQDGVALPDGFVPKKLTPGEKPPQFVVVSFDGVGWHEKWQYWFNIGKKVPFRFTGFLSGTYMLTEATKDHYDAPFYGPGHTEINWNSASDLPVEIDDVNQALASGDELGTHFNGHFCQSTGIPSGGNNWTTADWNHELDQFFMLIKNYKANNPGVDVPKLKLTANDIRGERTPCLEGHQEDLFPALVKHDMTYDSTFTKRGIAWPTQSKQYKIWQIGMAEYPMHGTISGNSDLSAAQRTQHVQITMDYNFYYSQEKASSKGVTPAQSKIDSQQVLDTYKDMYNDTYNGNRAPLILGNHLNEWNNNAYADAVSNFVLQTCGKPDTECVPFRDMIAWMEVQDPTRLAQLQAQAPELGKTVTK
ncbi:MAG: hypothetical protein ACR2P2_00910 [Nakamurella sp.]